MQIEHGVADVDEEAERLLQMVKVEREMLSRDLAAFHSANNSSIPQGLLDKLDKLTKIFNTVTLSVNRLDVTRERRARKMKKGDFLEAASRLIKSLEPGERGDWLRNMIKFHRRAAGRAIMEKTLENIEKPALEHNDV